MSFLSLLFLLFSPIRFASGHLPNLFNRIRQKTYRTLFADDMAFFGVYEDKNFAIGLQIRRPVLVIITTKLQKRVYCAFCLGSGRIVRCPFSVRSASSPE